MRLSSLCTLPVLLMSAQLSAAQNDTTPSNGIGSSPLQVRVGPQDTPSSLLTFLQRHYVSAAQAWAIVAAAEGAASAISVPQNIAVVDPSGLLVAFLRMDNAYPGSIDISIKKARTSVIFNGITSDALLNSSQPGGALYGKQILNSVLTVAIGPQC